MKNVYLSLMIAVLGSTYGNVMAIKPCSSEASQTATAGRRDLATVYGLVKQLPLGQLFGKEGLLFYEIFDENKDSEMKDRIKNLLESSDLSKNVRKIFSDRSKDSLIENWLYGEDQSNLLSYLQSFVFVQTVGKLEWELKDPLPSYCREDSWVIRKRRQFEERLIFEVELSSALSQKAYNLVIQLMPDQLFGKEGQLLYEIFNANKGGDSEIWKRIDGLYEELGNEDFKNAIHNVIEEIHPAAFSSGNWRYGDKDQEVLLSCLQSFKDRLPSYCKEDSWVIRIRKTLGVSEGARTADSALKD